MPCTGGCNSVSESPEARLRADLQATQKDLNAMRKELDKATQLLCQVTQKNPEIKKKVKGLDEWTQKHIDRDLNRVKRELTGALTKVIVDDKDNAALFKNPISAVMAAAKVAMSFYRDPRSAE